MCDILMNCTWSLALITMYAKELWCKWTIVYQSPYVDSQLKHGLEDGYLEKQ